MVAPIPPVPALPLTPAPGAWASTPRSASTSTGCARTGSGRARPRSRPRDLGALLLFDVNNIRYVTSTAIGEWSRDKMTRYALLTRTGEPMVWDFGSAAKHHRMYCPWLEPERHPSPAYTACAARSRPRPGLFAQGGARSTRCSKKPGSRVCRSGSTSSSRRCCSSCSARHHGARRAAGDARRARDQVARRDLLLSTSAALVDGAYQDIVEALKPGVRENQIVALATKRLYELGSDDVESINAVSGERCNPHPHNFSDRLIRPGDQAFFDIMSAFNGYRTCYYRTFSVGSATQAQRDAYKQCREWIDASIDLIRPGVTTDQVARVWPKAAEFGFPSEMEAFGLQFGHGSASHCTSGR